MFATLVKAMQGNANLLALLVMISWARLKVRESDGHNRGPIVDAIHELAGGDKEDAAAWCMRAVLAALTVAGWATMSELDPRISRSGSVHKMWLRTLAKAPELCIWAKDITDITKQVKPGDIMIRYELIDKKKGHVEGNAKNGHTEMVKLSYLDKNFDTCGGNTNDGVSREGDGVYEKSKKYSITQANVVGFIRPRFVPIKD